MNNFGKMAVIAALSILTISSAAQAATWMGTDQVGVDKTVEMLQDRPFSVIRLDSLEDNDPMSVYLTNPDEHKEDTAMLQKSLAASPKLIAALKLQKVEIDSVVAAQEALDGSVVFYLR